jgi:hypothetical protein
MKEENPENIKNPENSPAPGAPAKLRKKKKEKPKQEKKKPPVDDVHLPVLVELTYSISMLLLIFVGLSVVIVSVLTGASLLNLVLRTSAAMLAMGCLLVVIFYQVSSGSLQASLAEQEEAEKKLAEETEIPGAQVNPETYNKAEA